MPRRFLVVAVLLVATVPCLAQQGMGNDCTLAGSWYGGSVVAYQLMIAPSTPAGQYTFVFQAMYGDPTVTKEANPSGKLVKHGKVYEGSMLALSGDSTFITLPPGANGKLPDLYVGWVSMELVDCNTIRNTIPFFGIYFGAGIWKPGNPVMGVDWVSGGKVPLVSEPDVDLIPILTFDTKPIVETYHRLPEGVNRDLAAFHK